MSRISVGSKKVICAVSLIAAELVLFCTLGTPNSSLAQALRMIFAIVAYIPASLIFRGLLLVLLANRWTKAPISAVEIVAKWILFISPIFAVGFLELSSVTQGQSSDYVGQFVAYIAVECVLCFVFLRLNARWNSQRLLQTPAVE